MKNHVSIIGTLGKDPEIKSFKGGRVGKLALQTMKKWKDKSGNEKESTQWHNVSLWGDKLIDNSASLQKGDVVSVDGELNYNKVDNGKTSGYFADIKASNLIALNN